MIDNLESDTSRKAKKVSESETLSGIVIAQFWWGFSLLHIDMVYQSEGKPNWREWGPTECPHYAYHWASKQAAYKFLRENAQLAEVGYRVIDLHELGWPDQRSRYVYPDRKDGAS